MSQTQIHSRDVILPEADFVHLLQEASAPFGQWAAAVTAQPMLLGHSGTIARLADTADQLETFLDDHGARENRTFATFGEMVAGTRGLSGVKGVGLYLLSRLPRYQTVREGADLERKLQETDGVLDDALTALCGELMAECERLGLNWTATPVRPSGAPDVRRLLPRNVDADLSVDERQHIAELATKFRAVLKASRQLDLTRVRSTEELPAFVAEHASEDRCRWYESAVHNIQSMYDTFVLRTALEEEHPWLRNLRGHAAVARHLLEMATGLVHFYERHENDIRHEPARERIAKLVSKESVLDVAVNTCLKQAYLYVEECAGVAERIIETFVSRGTVSLPMPKGVSLHARPLALIVQIARHYRTPVEISIEGETCSAQSLMGLIMLAGEHPRPKEILAKGDPRVLADLKRLFEQGLGETESGLPEELGYLRTSS